MPEKDTLAEWLFQRFCHPAFYDGVTWDLLDADEKSFWKHEANAVRRAVARGGFKEEL